MHETWLRERTNSCAVHTDIAELDALVEEVLLASRLALTSSTASSTFANVRIDGSSTTTGKVVVGSTDPVNDLGALYVTGDIYATGNATAEGGSGNSAGALVGENHGGNISQSYATGSATAEGGYTNSAGALVGWNDFQNATEQVLANDPQTVEIGAWMRRRRAVALATAPGWWARLLVFLGVR